MRRRVAEREALVELQPIGRPRHPPGGDGQVGDGVGRRRREERGHHGYFMEYADHL